MDIQFLRYLHRFAEAHVVGKDAAEAGGALEPRH